MALQLDQIIEGVGATQLAGVDQAHEQIADFSAVQSAIVQSVLSMQNPKLTLSIEVSNMMMDPPGHDGGAMRRLIFGLKNEGRGMAKFPGVRFKRSGTVRPDHFGIDGNGGFGIPMRPSEPEWMVFRGGVDDVIYPGETRLVGKLIQTAVHKGDRGIPPKLPPGQVAVGFAKAERLFVCEAQALEYEISAEGTATEPGAYKLPEDSITFAFTVR